MSETILTAQELKDIRQKYLRYCGVPVDDLWTVLKALERVQEAIQKELRKDDSGKFNVTAEAQFRLAQTLRETGGG